MNADSGAWKVRWMASIKTRILRYRKKRVWEAGGYIGGRCAKAQYSSILHVTTYAMRAIVVTSPSSSVGKHLGILVWWLRE